MIVCLYKAIFWRTRIQTENYYKVLMFYRFSDGKYVKSEQNIIRWFLGTAFFQLVINTLLSWLSVILRIIGLVTLVKLKKKVKETYTRETLDKVEELRLKIKYTQLSKSEMEESLTKIDELLWTHEFVKDNVIEDEDEEYEDEEEENEYIISQHNWTDSFIIEGNKLYVNSHPDDYLSDFHSVYEYKIKWTKVYVRETESRTEHAGSEEYYDIKDWVVLESDIIKRNKWEKFLVESSEDEIKRLKEQVEWQEFKDTRVKAFILHENLSEEDFRRYARWEIERLKVGKMKVEELCEEYWVNFICKNDGDTKYWSIDTKGISKEELADKKSKGFNIKKTLKECNCELWEIEDIDNIIEDFEMFMKKKRN